MMIIEEKPGQIGTKKHFSSYVVRFIGPRGSGKSLLLARFGLQALCSGSKVWSNMPLKVTKDVIDWEYRFKDSETRHEALKKYVGMTSLPLDWDAFYSLSSDLVEGTVLIDEAQYFSDARSALSLKNRLLNAIVAQVRKRSLNLYYTVKQGDWVDRRLTYETDIEIECEGMHRTIWGRENHIVEGDVVLTRWYDLSGAATGHPVDPKRKYFKSYKARIFHGLHHIWDCYDTSAVVDLEEAFTNVKLDLKQRVISNKEPIGDTLNSLYGVAAALKDKGNNEISTASFWGLAEAMGIEGKSQRLGRYLADIGVTRKQKSGGSYVYDLSNLGQGEKIPV